MEESQLHSNELLGMETTQSNDQLHAKSNRSTKIQGVHSTRSLSSGNGNHSNRSRRGGRKNKNKKDSLSSSNHIESTCSGHSSTTKIINQQEEKENSNNDRNVQFDIILQDSWRTRQETIRRRKDICNVLLGSIREFYVWIECEWNNFFHSRTDTKGGGLLRIGYSILALLNTMHLFVLDFDYYFLDLIPIQTGIDSYNNRAIVTPFTLLVNESYETQEYYLQLGSKLWMFQITLLLLGIAPRFNAIGNFFWCVTFQHHNNLLFDGSDALFRMFGFFLIFFPLHRYTIWDIVNIIIQKKNNKKDDSNNNKKESSSNDVIQVDTWPMWPFRLMQIETCLMFFSAGVSKMADPTWYDGLSMYYMVHSEEFFGKLFAPDLLFGYMNSLIVLGWSTLLLEGLAPLVIWIEPCRIPAVISLLLFHIGIDLSMNLEFFHWITMIGWLTFLVQPILPEEQEQEQDNNKVNHSNNKSNVNVKKEIPPPDENDKITKTKKTN